MGFDSDLTWGSPLKKYVEIVNKVSFLGDKKLKEMVGHTPIQVLTGAVFGVTIGFLMPMI